MFRQAKLAIGLAAISSAGFGFLGVTPSASAFVFNGTTVEDITADDIGDSFIINFDGNVEGNNVDELSSWAKFTLDDFTGTQATFGIELENTSTGNITSRTSALGFNIDGATLDNASVATGGLFENVHIGGAFPNGFGHIDTCFTDGNNCQGGQNGGVSTGEKASTFTATVQLTESVQKFALSNFGVRYQSINGDSFNGASGTGRATPYYEAPPPQSIPEPSTVGAVLLSGFALVQQRRRKQKKNSESE